MALFPCYGTNEHMISLLTISIIHRCQWHLNWLEVKGFNTHSAATVTMECLFNKGDIPSLHDYNKVIFVGIFKTNYTTVVHQQSVLHIDWGKAVFFTVLYPGRFRYQKHGRLNN